MAFIAQNFLFSWDQIDAASDLDRLRLVIEAIPGPEENGGARRHCARGAALDGVRSHPQRAKRTDAFASRGGPARRLTKPNNN